MGIQTYSQKYKMFPFSHEKIINKIYSKQQKRHSVWVALILKFVHHTMCQATCTWSYNVLQNFLEAVWPLKSQKYDFWTTGKFSTLEFFLGIFQVQIEAKISLLETRLKPNIDMIWTWPGSGSIMFRDFCSTTVVNPN